MPESVDYPHLLARLLENSEAPSVQELSKLSDLDHEQLALFVHAWDELDGLQRLTLLTLLGNQAEEHVELQYEGIYKHALDDEDALIRKLAIGFLWESQDPKLALKMLASARDDPSPLVRLAATRALGQFILLGQFNKLEPEILQALEKQLLENLEQDESLDLRNASIESLGYSSLAEVEDHIRGAYHSGDEHQQVSAVIAMGRSANDAFSEIILLELDSKLPGMRAEAARSAGELELRSAVAPLIDLLQDVDDEARKSAVWSLGQIGGTAAREALQDLLGAPDSETISEQIEEALEYIAFLEGTPDFLLLDFDEEEEPD